MTEHEKKGPQGSREKIRLAVKACALVFLIFILVSVVTETARLNREALEEPYASQTEAPVQTDPVTPPPAQTEAPPEPTPEQTQAPVVPTPTPTPDFEPYAVEETQPEKYIDLTAVNVDGTTMTVEEYSCEDDVDFLYGEEYSALEGVITFRGNNFRDSAAYGTAQINTAEFGEYWYQTTGALQAPDGNVWTGNGWTGQPLIAKWPKETRQQMNMHDWAKEQDELVEVIYASMDGKVYFLELTTGKKTRDDLNLGFTFKGAGALDPRGYPLLYVGSGYDSLKGGSRAFVVSLIDGSILYEFGKHDSFALRAWHMFDSSPLVDAETDTLIWPGESGILYKIKLNTSYDPEAGTIDVNPSVTKWRYSHARNFGWLGMECSAAIWRGHLFMVDNGGCLICLDINTLETVWVQNTLDDTNCSPVLELEDGHPYIYMSTSFHYGWRSWSTATIPIWKIDAVTGEIVWQTDYTCYTVADVSGGVQGTPAIGKNDLAELIFVPVSRTPSGSTGILAALNKATGEVVWEVETLIYSWSSPTLVYDQNGKGYVILCTSGGYIYILDGLTGERLDSMNLGSNIEASPAVYENTVVVGTRGQYIYGINMK